MIVKNIIDTLNGWAPPAYQENYDNAGLLTGSYNWECTGIMCSLDATEDVLLEAVEKGCNLLVAHHPILFKGLKTISGNSYVERAIIQAIKNNISIFAIHTNLDNIQTGVNAAIAKKLGLLNAKVLLPKDGLLCKLYTYAPADAVERIKNALFECGAGKIGLYQECSFTAIGNGSFKPVHSADPFIGTIDIREELAETKIEFIFPAYLQSIILKKLFEVHPYETVAYEVIRLENANQDVGSGMIGSLQAEVKETDFLEMVKEKFGLSHLRHTPLLNKNVKTIAVCGGSGSFLIKKAIAANADVYITSDIKYHEFFDADGRILLADIGHWESEQFTTDLIASFLHENFPTFAVQKTGVYTNPVRYK